MKVRQAWVWMSAGAVCVGLAGCRSRTVVVHEESQPRVVYVEQQPPPPVVVQEAPPPIYVETPPPPPSRGHVWIEGYWHLQGHRYVWQHGHWEKPPREHAVWIAPRYERIEGHVRYVPGYWHVDEHEHHDRH